MSIRKNVDTLLRKLENEFATHNLIEVARLASRQLLAETSRIMVDDMLPAEFDTAADAVFEAPGDIEESRSAFNKIVGEIIYG